MKAQGGLGKREITSLRVIKSAKLSVCLSSSTVGDYPPLDLRVYKTVRKQLEQPAGRATLGKNMHFHQNGTDELCTDNAKHSWGNT